MNTSKTIKNSDAAKASDLANLHDGSLVAISVGQKRRLRLEIVASNGCISRINLEGLRHLKCDNFREGNIVLSITTGAAELISDEELGILLEMNPSDLMDLRLIREEKERCVQHDIILMRLVPSYGCEVLALCETITIETVV